MLLRELDRNRLGGRPRILYAQPHPAYLNTAGLSGYGAAFGRSPTVPGRVLYDGLGNPVGILPFIAALAPIAAKLFTALPAIAGKAATLLPKITAVTSSLAPSGPAPQANIPPPAPLPSAPPSPTPPVATPVPAEATQVVQVPMRAPNGTIVMVRRRVRRRRGPMRISRPATVYRPAPAPVVTDPAPPNVQANPLRGWHG